MRAVTHKGKQDAETANLLLFCMLVLHRAGVQQADVMASRSSKAAISMMAAK